MARYVCFVVLALVLKWTSALQCYECQNVTDVHACNQTITCAANEVCYMGSTTLANTKRTYTLTCKDKLHCNPMSSTGALIGRSVDNVGSSSTKRDVACHECCSTALCNKALCNHPSPATCTDDQSVDCAKIHSLFNVCADIQKAKLVCPRFCNLCSIDEPTTLSTTKAPSTTTIALTTPTTTDPKYKCESDAYVYDVSLNLCLRFFTDLKNWTEAQGKCMSLNGTLVIKGDGDQKMKDVLAFYQKAHYTIPMYIGATSQGATLVFHWGDGHTEIVNPNEGKDLSESQCLMIYNGSYRNTDVCSAKHGYICERIASSRSRR